MGHDDVESPFEPFQGGAEIRIDKVKVGQSQFVPAFAGKGELPGGRVETGEIDMSPIPCQRQQIGAICTAQFEPPVTRQRQPRAAVNQAGKREMLGAVCSIG